MSLKQRIAWFSPLNIDASLPTSSVSAYTSDELLPLLKDEFEIDLYSDSFETYRDYPTFHYLTAFKHHQRKPYDAFFYQIEDHELSDFTRFFAGVVPGVTWFHDVFYLRDLPTPLRNSPWREVLDKFHFPEKEWPDRDGIFPRSLPFAIRECSQSFIKIFSCERNFCEYRAQNPSTTLKGKNSGDSQDAFFLPFPVDISLKKKHKETQTPIVGFCGSALLDHRAHKLLSALSQLDSEFELLWLLDENELPQATTLVEEFNVKNVVFETPRSPSHWKQLVSRLKVAVHTLFSVYSHPEPYLSISLMAGIPSIVTNFATTEFLPDNIVFKVQAGHSEAQQIHQLLSLILNTQETTSIGTTPNSYTQEYSDSRSVAKELSTIFKLTSPLLSELNARWSNFEANAESSLISECAELFPQLIDNPILRASCNKTQPKRDLKWNDVCAPIFRELGWEK